MFRRFLSGRGTKRVKQGRGEQPASRSIRLPGSRSRIPVFQLLELRALLSGNTYIPSLGVADSTSSTDNNLRSAIAAANADTGTTTDTIQLDIGTYSLLLGELEISNTAHSLIIRGFSSTGPNATIIDQQSLDRVFQIDPGVSVTFEDLEITGGTAQPDSTTGSAQGGGILSHGNLTLTDVALIGNKATAANGGTGQGGAIYSDNGDLTISSTTPGNSLIEDNSALGGAGISSTNSGGGGGSNGGGIFLLTNNSVSITDTTIADNLSQGGNSTSGSTSSGGSADGGAAYISNSGPSAILLDSDTITGNQAIGGAGGHNSAGYAIGGGLEVLKGGFDTAASGPPALVTNSTIAYNTAQGGVGGTSLANGIGGFAVGGGIAVLSPKSELLNDTVYGNKSLGGDGPSAGSAYGGGIDDETPFLGASGSLSIVNATVAFNTAQAGTASQLGFSFAQGGGIDNGFAGSDPALVIVNSIVAKNTAPSGPDVLGTVAETDSNLIGDPTGSVGFSAGVQDRFGTPALPLDPLLGPLQNNGGPTLTAALLPGSQAINNGDVAAAQGAGLTNDQRGLPRILNNNIDIGAYETQQTLVTTTTLGTTSNAITVGQGVTFTATVSPPIGITTTPTGTVTFNYSGSGPDVTLGTATLVNGVATFQSLSLPLGTGTVTAIYSGNSSFLGSTSASQSEAVTESFTEIALVPLSTVNDSNSATDDNLRAAVAAADANPGIFGDTIFLQAGTYALTQGSISITNSSHTLTIVGNGSTGPDATIIDQLALDRVFQIAPNATLVLENLEITGGLGETDSGGGTTEADGGGIVDLGTLTLTNVAIVGNKAVSTVASDAANGGGVYISQPSLSLGGLTANGTNVIAYNSVITTTGVQNTSSGASGSASGGGIYSTGGGSIDISGTTLNNNFVQAGAGAAPGGPNNGGAGGTAQGGGASFSFTGVWITLDDDTLAGNIVYGGNGGSTAGSVGGAGGTAQGGGMADVLGQVNTTDSTISGNTALGGTGGIGSLAHGIGGNAFGGGVFMGNAASGIDEVYNDTIYGNSALGGAGENAGSGYGGGIEDSMTSGALWPTNSTIVGNTAKANSQAFGGTAGQGVGGGIDHNFVTTGSMSVTNTLIAQNTAATGPDFAGGTTFSRNSLLGNDSTATGFDTGFDADLLGTPSKALNPKLGQLQNNGGPTKTMAPLVGSPAIGAGDVGSAESSGLTNDQRGLPRVVSGTIDIGAYQTQTITAPTVTVAATTENTQTTSGLFITPSTAATTFYQITGITGGTLFLADGITPVTSGEFITLAQGAAGLKFTPSAGSLATGSFTVQQSTSNAVAGLAGSTVTATIAVTFAGPSVTNATTFQNIQSTTGLVITPGANDSSAAYFRITLITGGTLYQNDGVTPIVGGTFITLAQGAAGLKFTPTTGTVPNGSFSVQESTINGVNGVSGVTAKATISLTLIGPTVTPALTLENTQSGFGLVITPGSNAGSATYFQITSIAGGTLYQNNGTTQIASNSFITVAQGEAGLKFTPTTGSVAAGTFNIQQSTSNLVSGLSGPTTPATISVILGGPLVTNAATTENTQTTSGLVLKTRTNDTSAAYFQITNVSGGTLYQNDGFTPIANGAFISVAQGAAGVKFTPSPGSLAGGSFNVKESTTSDATGLSGATVAATINVALAGPSATDASTPENAQTTSGLVISRGSNDSSAAYFQITNIIGGTLYQNNGTTPITNGSFITLAQGAAGLIFTPTTGSLTNGSFDIQESTTASATGLNGGTAEATITINSTGPSVTNASTSENTETTSGLVLTVAASDNTTAYFQITGIAGGTLFENDGTTPISNGNFIPVSQGAAGLKFTPTPGSLASGSFTAEESTTGDVGGLTGATTSATISVSLAGPAVTTATTTENKQSTSGLVITPGGNDTTEATFLITNITGGTLYQNDGTTPIVNGSFVTVVQGAAGLKFTPTTGSLAGGSFNIEESTTGDITGLSGPTVTATISVTLSSTTVTSASTTENTQTTSGLVITPGSGPTTFFQITGITGGTLYQNNGTTQITSGSFISLAQGAAGLKFTPTTGSLASGGFTVQESTTNAVGGLTGVTTSTTINVTLAGPSVTGTSTTENTQTTSGLVIKPGTHDSTATFFQITGITGGTLYQNDGVTPITTGSFITLTQAAAGLKFTPTTGSLSAGSFTVQESTTNAVGGLSGPTVKAAIGVALAGPSVTGASTVENTQTTSGLVIKPGTNDSTAAYFQITVITGGTLYQNNGTTQIATGSFITLAQGAAGLKFMPAPGSLAAGGFSVQESTTNAVAGLNGPTAAATISVTLAGPAVTAATTMENNQSTSGLVITAGVNDSTAAFFQITGVTGGTLFQNDGTTQIASGSFITLAQGAAGLKFMPAPGSLANGSFNVQESTTNAAGGLNGPTAAATITVTPSGPTVTSATTTENTQTTSGLVITPLSGATTFFQITGITGGTLYQNDGVTPIASGSFITLTQGAAGLKFTPTTGSLATGSFNVQESTTNAVGGLSGVATAATVSVALAGPAVTGAVTTENTQTTSGLVITPGSNDSTAAFFQITSITGGTLYQNDGVTPIASGSFITVAQGSAGLKFTPTTGSVANGGFSVEESTTNAVGGLSGPTAVGGVIVAFAGPGVTGAATLENIQTNSGLVITPGANDSTAAFFQITGITGGTLYQNDGTTPITGGSFITIAQGAAGLKFTPTTGSAATGGFTVQESTTNAAGGLSGPTAAAAISVTLTGTSVTAATTTENTQTTSGLVVAAISGATNFFEVTGISGGTLYQNDGSTPIANGDFITVAQGTAGLKFTPTTGSLATGSFTVGESTTNSVGGLSGATATGTITVTLAGPSVTSSATTENTQTASGLVITPGTNDSTAAFFQITAIAGGTLYQNNGTTPIVSGSFITLAQGAAGLKFTPTAGSVATGSFTVQESTSNAVGGLSGPTAAATIGVTLAGPSVTSASTTENTQSTAGLVIKPGTHDGTAIYFQITGITGGTLYQNNGITPITAGSFITVAQGAAGLKFTPTTGSLAAGSFTVQESTSTAVGGLSGPTAAATIAVTLAGPSVTSATTGENTQSVSGLVIRPATRDTTAVYFQITGITGGTLYQNNGTTPIVSGSFITVAQGAAGLKFSPTPGSLTAGGFTVQESTTNAVGGLSGKTAAATINVTLAGPSVTNTTTTENTQTVSGLVINRGSNDSSAAFFQITSINGGTLYQNNGTTPITNGSFITLAQGVAGLKFTPNTGSLIPGGFTVRESTTSAVGGLSGVLARAAIAVSLAGPKVTGATTTEDTQTASGLVITPGGKDSTAAYFQITGIIGGTLYQHDGMTAIANGSYITLAQGSAGLRFTPTDDSLVPGSMSVQESTTNAVGGLTGATAIAAIAVTLSEPKVTSASTTANTQTASGLVITPGVNDSTVAYFQITNITGGKLYQNDGTTPIVNGSFIALSQGESGLKFTPNTGTLVAGGFSVREATSNAISGLSGPTARAAIAVSLSGPMVTGAMTTQNTQSTSGLVVTPGAKDSMAAYLLITSVTGGTLYQHNGTTPITSGSYITLAQGAAGLKFTPNTGSLVAGGFTVQESTTSAASGLSGPTARAAIAVTLSQPTVTGATTTENSQTVSGLVITPGARDTGAAYFQITSINGGTLFQNDGFTPIANGAFITLAQGVAGLRFTPNTGSLVAGGFTVREATTGAVSGLSGLSTRAAIAVALSGPTVTNAATTENTQSTSGLVIRPGTGDSAAAYFQITSLNGGKLYQNDGVTAIANGSFITVAQGAAGLTFTPNTGSLIPGGFTVRESATNDASGLSGTTARAAIAITYSSDQVVNLSNYYNLTGITADRTTFTGGLDGNGHALSATLLGTSQTWNGANFTIAPAGANNVVQAVGQTITLPNASFAKLELLATSVNGNQPNQTFTIHYTDGSSQTVTQSMSDWHMPQSYTGETVVQSEAYRNTSTGNVDNFGPFRVYGYSFTLDSTKAVQSITLPSDSHVAVLAISTVAVITAPTDLTATVATDTEALLSWTAAAGSVSGYNVYRGTVSGGESTTPLNGTALVTSTSFVDTTAVPGTPYFYVVLAVHDGISGPPSNEAELTLPDTSTITSFDLRASLN